MFISMPGYVNHASKHVSKVAYMKLKCIHAYLRDPRVALWNIGGRGGGMPWMGTRGGGHQEVSFKVVYLQKFKATLEAVLGYQLRTGGIFEEKRQGENLMPWSI
jgi:hypothetical protein